jgi:nitrate reductase alpha subunit
VPAYLIEKIAREFADTAHKTHGRSMIILGAGVNHWYHMDMNYRGMINMLVFCGCVGQSGGGWSHYVGQENCARKPAGCRWPSRWTGTVRRVR